MSKTHRHDPEWEPEIEFPYIPRCVPILQVGEPYSAEENRAYVRWLHQAHYPNRSANFDRAISGSCGSGCKIALG